MEGVEVLVSAELGVEEGGSAEAEGGCEEGGAEGGEEARCHVFGLL